MCYVNNNKVFGLWFFLWVLFPSQKCQNWNFCERSEIVKLLSVIVRYFYLTTRSSISVLISKITFYINIRHHKDNNLQWYFYHRMQFYVQIPKVEVHNFQLITNKWKYIQDSFIDKKCNCIGGSKWGAASAPSRGPNIQIFQSVGTSGASLTRLAPPNLEFLDPPLNCTIGNQGISLFVPDVRFSILKGRYPRFGYQTWPFNWVSFKK